MDIGFEFDVKHYEPHETLTCTILLKANPKDIPAFSTYKNGEIKREFVLDLQQTGSPVILDMAIQKDIGDHGDVKIGWSCKNKREIVASDNLIVEMGE
jgi:hypothetical protein